MLHLLDLDSPVVRRARRSNPDGKMWRRVCILLFESNLPFLARLIGLSLQRLIHWILHRRRWIGPKHQVLERRRRIVGGELVAAGIGPLEAAGAGNPEGTRDANPDIAENHVGCKLKAFEEALGLAHGARRTMLPHELEENGVQAIALREVVPVLDLRLHLVELGKKLAHGVLPQSSCRFNSLTSIPFKSEGGSGLTLPAAWFGHCGDRG
mmetsp:Transcript_61712/g.127489  ORF Transcript_61712/g.127489 Transcript_61712/m.127489 type:complete len:210 (+) Transcript_61712:1845-2474(+)